MPVETREEAVNRIMGSMAREWRYCWSTKWKTKGCANTCGFAYGTISKDEWKRWIEENPGESVTIFE